MTRDVSPGGLSLSLAAPTSRGTRINGAIVLEGEPYRFAGVIAWSTTARPGKPTLVGVRFTGVSSLLLARLQRTFTPTSLPRVLLPSKWD